MARPTARTKLEREEHLATVATLHMRGRKQFEIAGATSRSQGQISKDIHVVEQRWMDAQLQSMDKHKARLSATLVQLANEAWDAWSDTRHPSHFANALSATRDLRTLLGADAPKKTETEVSGSFEVRHVDELTDADLDAIARGNYDIAPNGSPVVGGKTVALPALGAA